MQQPINAIIGAVLPFVPELDTCVLICQVFITLLVVSICGVITWDDLLDLNVFLCFMDVVRSVATYVSFSRDQTILA